MPDSRRAVLNSAPLVYSLDEAAHLLNVSRSTVYRFIRDGRLASIRLGGRHGIPATEVHRLASQGTDTPPAPAVSR